MGAIVNGPDGAADIDDEDLRDAVRTLSHRGPALLVRDRRHFSWPLRVAALPGAGRLGSSTPSAAVVGLVA